MVFSSPHFLQIARPALFDQAVVTSMVLDIDNVDLSNISSQPLLSVSTTADQDPDIYSECEIDTEHEAHVFSNWPDENIRIFTMIISTDGGSHL